MNERIKILRKLADRAGEYADFESYLCTDKFLDKFAQLLYEEIERDADEWYEELLWGKR